jgi:hypothetical protein
METQNVGMFISIDRYNRLADIEHFETKLPSGVSVTMVSMETRIPMIVPPNTTFGQVAEALRGILGAGEPVQVHGVEGILYEMSDTVACIYTKQPFAPLFVTFGE